MFEPGYMATLGAQLLLGTILVVAILSLPGTGAAHILIFNSYVGNATRSHFFALQKMAKHLASHGHHVTYAVSVHESAAQTSADVDYVRFSSAFTQSEWQGLLQTINEDNMRGNIGFSHLLHMLHTQQKECEAMLADEEFYQRLKNAHFDVAVVDGIFTCGYLYARRLGLKFIVFECATHMSSVTDSIDPFPLSYSPVMFSELSDKMSFFQRLYNAFTYYTVKTCTGIMSQGFHYLGEKHGITRGETVTDIRRSAELYLLNSDFAFDFPRPVPSNIILTGGILTEPAKPLPSHFEEIVSSAKYGVIVMSFGTYRDIGSMPRLCENLIEGLSKLPQVIIWSTKYRPTKAVDNILMYDWIPQNDLLGHPNVMAWVNHGGVNGILQGIYHAVPTLVLPTGFDCNDNAVRIQHKGLGLVVRPSDITPDVIHSAVSELINNKTYKSNALRLSAIMKDRPLTPVETASFWIEHVIRHGGAHLRPAGQDLSFVALNMLDVQLTFLIAVLLIIYGLYTLCRWCGRRCQSSIPEKIKAN